MLISVNLLDRFIFHCCEHVLFCLFVICSVQKLSEFFSSDEIGDEQEPRPMLTSGSSNHNQNRYQAVVSTRTLLCLGLSLCSICFAGRRCFIQSVLPCFECFLPPPHRLPINITVTPFVLCAECCTTLLQSSSKPFPPSSSSSLSRHLKPLKVVNRKRPPRDDDWNNFSSQGDHEGNGPSHDVHQDICIKVRQMCQTYNI